MNRHHTIHLWINIIRKRSNAAVIIPPVLFIPTNVWYELIQNTFLTAAKSLMFLFTIVKCFDKNIASYI